MTVINLNQDTPHVEVKLNDKTYTVYANDKTMGIISQILDFYDKFQDKLSTLQDPNSDESIDYSKEINDIFASAKQKFTGMLDELLNEPGIGEKLWKQKHGSTEYTIQAVTAIQDGLMRAREDYARQQQQEINKQFPVNKVKKLRHAKSNQ